MSEHRYTHPATAPEPVPFVAMIRDDLGNGVIAASVEGWGICPGNERFYTRVYLSGGCVNDLAIDRDEFTERLDRALTAMRGGAA